MENASKALIMAAEVLIGILIMSLMVYLFVSFGSESAEVNKELNASKLAEFNSQFEKYKDSQEITIYDIVSVANLARENNDYYELTSSTNGNYYIIVKLDGVSLESKSSKDLTQIIEKSMRKNNSLINYLCSNVIHSEITGRVKEVDFITN